MRNYRHPGTSLSVLVPRILRGELNHLSFARLWKDVTAGLRQPASCEQFYATWQDFYEIFLTEFNEITRCERVTKKFSWHGFHSERLWVAVRCFVYTWGVNVRLHRCIHQLFDERYIEIWIIWIWNLNRQEYSRMRICCHFSVPQFFLNRCTRLRRWGVSSDLSNGFLGLLTYKVFEWKKPLTKRWCEVRHCKSWFPPALDVFKPHP